MLYINNIDNYSFSMGTSESEDLQAYAKEFYARNVLLAGTATHGLVTIQSKERHFNLVNLIDPADIVINGVTFTEAVDVVTAFNSMMNNVLITTTTTTAPVTTTTTTTP